MPRKFFQRFLPHPATIKENKSLRIFGNWLHDPDLWHLNRRSVAGAFAVGLFFAWMPVPFQMLLAAGAAIWLRTNLPLSVVTVWISNPVTIPPMFSFELTFDWLLNELAAIWKPFLVGCFTLAASSSLIAYLTIQGIWRYSVLNRRSTKSHLKKKR